MSGFLWKPVSESNGRLVVLLPSDLTNKVKNVKVVTPDGRSASSKFTGVANGGRGHYRFDAPGGAYPRGSSVVATLEDGRQVKYTVGNTGSRNEGVKGVVGGSGDGGGGDQEGGGTTEGGDAEFGAGDGGGVGETGGEFSTSFPIADASEISFDPIEPTFIPNLEIPVVDPIERTAEVGDFNRGEFQENFEIGKKNALELNQLEFDSLQDFNRQARALQAEGVAQENVFNQGEMRGANVFNRGEVGVANQFNRGEITQANTFNQATIGPANQFNQKQRLQQLERALPGARGKILSQIDRGQQMSEGRFAVDAEDRAYEVAARNAGADAVSVKGFGADSVFGKRTSEMLSAQQRLELGQVGAQQVDRFLQLGATLAFDQPIKFNPIQQNPQAFQPQQFQPQQARTSQDVRGAPSQPASVLAVQQQESLGPLTTIQPGQTIGFDINQNQFQGNLDQRTNEFNSTLDFEAQRFNSSAALQIELEKFMAETFNAQAAAGAANNSAATGLAQENFETGIEAGQSAATIGAVGQTVGTVGSIIAQTMMRSGGGAPLAVPGSGAAVAGTAEAAGAAGAGVAGAAAAGGGATGVGGSFAPMALSGGTGFGDLAVSGAVSEGGAAVGTAGQGAAATSGVSGAALSSVLVPAGIAAVAAAGGMGIMATVQGLSDGSITRTDAKQGMAALGLPSNVVEQGLNEMFGRPLGRQDVANAHLLANPVTAPFAVADMLGVDIGFGSGKSEQQQERDSLRSLGTDVGAFFQADSSKQEHAGLEDGHIYTRLASGQAYDIGKDGGAKLKNYGMNVDKKGERNTYDIDWSDPRASESVGLLNPVAFMLFGKNADKMIGHMWNGATSDNRSLSETKQNIKQYTENAGLDYHTGVQILKQYKQQGHIDQATYLAMTNGWNDLMLTEGVRNEVVI